MHLGILDDQRKQLLNQLQILPFMKLFMMGEGTALSLQLGLRQSFDFDFFTKEHFKAEAVIAALQRAFGNKVDIINKSDKPSTVDAYIDDIKVSFSEYPHKEIGESVLLDEYPKIRMLSIEDIACMKSVAIYQRGTKKDFYDLFFILKDLSLKKNLHKLLFKKYGEKYLLISFYKSMTYFEDAREEALPKSFVPYSWDEIEEFFNKYSRDFLDSIFSYSFND